jgi:signal transduction histidine kinase
MKDDFLQAIVVFFSDVSESEQIRIRTQQLEHRAFLGEFTAVFAHEVRNPINNISTGLQLLTTKLTNEDPNQEIISRMQADCTRLTQLMESVLSFSRPIETKFEPFNIGLLLQRILDRWRPRLSKVNVTALLQVEENLSLVDGDPRSIEQVFTNLISNAVDAMSSDGGTLAVKIIQSLSAASRQQIEVTVSDNGPGIPDEIRERIFEPFVSTKAKGTGLGLAITKRIITAHKGSITVNSFPGGTIFRVVIPAHIGE